MKEGLIQKQTQKTQEVTAQSVTGMVNSILDRLRVEEGKEE